MRTIWWDMDGTIANLYAVNDWLPKLRSEDPSPYAEAEVMWNMSQLARLMNRVQKLGYKLGIISWTSKDGDLDYDCAVRDAKWEWLFKHLPSVNWNYVRITSYGVSKTQWMKATDDILFDDNPAIRDKWIGDSYPPEQILSILKELLQQE